MRFRPISLIDFKVNLQLPCGTRRGSARVSRADLWAAAFGLMCLVLCPSSFGQSYEPVGYVPTWDSGYEKHSVWWFLTASLSFILILVAFLATLNSLAHAFVGDATNNRLKSVEIAWGRLTLWPRQLDPLVLIGSILACYLLIWVIPPKDIAKLHLHGFYPGHENFFLLAVAFVGFAAHVLFFGLVVPLGAFVLTWQLLTYLTRNSGFDSDIYKRLAVSLTAALIFLQFGFEFWGYVLLKLLAMIAVSSFFLRSTSLISYRLFLIPAAFAFLLSINRLFGQEPAVYLLARLGLNGAIIFLALKSFMEISGDAAGQFFPPWNQIVTACRTLIGSDNEPASATSSVSNAEPYSSPDRGDCESADGPHVPETAPAQNRLTNLPLPGRRYFHTDGKEVFGPFDASAMLALENSGSITQQTLICEEGLELWTKLSDSSLAAHLPKRPKPPKWAASSATDHVKRSLSFWTPRWASIPCIIFLVLTFLGGTETTNSRFAGTVALTEGVDYSRSRDNAAAFTILSFLAGDANGMRYGLNEIKKGDARAASRLEKATSDISKARESQEAFFTLSLLFGAIWLGMQIFVCLKRRSLSAAS
jgi:hypothetical protein